MISNAYHLVVFDPLYNGLIFLFDTFPWIDAGLAVIIFTILVRLILYPLSKKSVVTQVKMKEIQPELEKIKQNTPDKQQQALKVMELYKSKGVNPFSSFFLLFLQLPIIYSLYYIFVRSGLPVVDTNLLYSVLKDNLPSINMHFLGFFDLAQRSIFLSVIASIAQFLQLHFSIASNSNPSPSSSGGNSSMDAAANMMKNMKYIFPVMIFFISYKISAVVAVYWTVSSLFTLGQELVVRRHIRKHQPL